MTKGKSRKELPTSSFSVTLPDRMVRYMDALIATGMYGLNYSECARHLLSQAIHAAVTRGEIAPHPGEELIGPRFVEPVGRGAEQAEAPPQDEGGDGAEEEIVDSEAAEEPTEDSGPTGDVEGMHRDMRRVLDG